MFSSSNCWRASKWSWSPSRQLSMSLHHISWEMVSTTYMGKGCDVKEESVSLTATSMSVSISWWVTFQYVFLRVLWASLLIRFVTDSIQSRQIEFFFPHSQKKKGSHHNQTALFNLCRNIFQKFLNFLDYTHTHTRKPVKDVRPPPTPPAVCSGSLGWRPCWGVWERQTWPPPPSPTSPPHSHEP